MEVAAKAYGFKTKKAICSADREIGPTRTRAARYLIDLINSNVLSEYHFKNISFLSSMYLIFVHSE